MPQPSAKPRVVVDTNLFVSGTILKRGVPHAILNAWRASAFLLILSTAQYVELIDVFRRPKLVERYRLTTAELDDLFAWLAALPQTEPTGPLPVRVRDAKDEHMLAAALAGGADYLVTGDDDLLVLRDDPRLGDLRILTAAEFLAAIQERK